MTKAKKTFSLREKKYAKTKIALASEFMTRMKTTRFSEISIKEVCEKVEVSEGTFYNYFPHKTDIIHFHFLFMTLRLVWVIETQKSQLKYWEKIEHIFDIIADDILDPFTFYEMISVKTAERLCHDDCGDLTEAEKVIGLPESPGIEKIDVTNIESFFAKILKQAQKDKQLSSAFKVDDIVYALMSTIIGMPLAIDIKDFGKLKKLYKTQLSLLWKALGIKKRK